MKSLSWSAMGVTLVGLVAGALTIGLALSNEAQLAALCGVATSTVLGVVSLMIKAREPGEGTAAIRSMLSSQVLALGLRAVALFGVGLVLHRRGVDPLPYVVAFFGCYVMQQLIEMRFVLGRNASARAAVSPPEVMR